MIEQDTQFNQYLSELRQWVREVAIPAEEQG